MYKFGTYEDISADLDKAEPCALDLETCGLYGRIRIAQFYQSHWKEVIIVDNPDPIELMLFLLKTSEVNYILQVGSYDISTIQTQTGGRFIPKVWNDTFYLARLAYPRLKSLKLDNILESVLGFDPYAENGINKAAMQKISWDKVVLPDDQLLYAAIDVYYLLDAYDKVKHMEKDINYKLDMISANEALDWQNNGFPVLLDEVEKQYASNLKKIKEIDLPINCNSWQQVRPYIDYHESDALALAKLTYEGNTRAKDVNATRKLVKQNSFLDKFITDDGRIYGRFGPLARSGRYTCKQQNLQQLPRKLKHCFGIDPKTGRILLYSDYPQLELRTIAALVREQTLIMLFKQGLDPHGHVAALLFGKDWTRPHRQLTKTYNFNLLYVGGATMVQSILIKDFDTYRDIDLIKREIRAWKRAWPAIARWQEECISSHRHRQLKSTPMGRRYMGERITDHANIENQGGGGEVAKLAMHYMIPKLKEHDALLCNFIHDSYLVEMDYEEEHVREVANIMADCMQEAWTEWCQLDAVLVKDIPMPIDVLVGYNWGEMENDNYLFKVEKK